ncbi:MAG: hypothetical protein A3F54_02655 [Candidatus Kerfeldbacteria bacterium RIFCSPHIGHO2_12_FULL_48_17]|uniref:Uncharacterized protein n=1 Tax=Candidatus Kerfeldbacteria bacterium RIFCSPHIGHO2_12_FULL_48_17 TaxID=1798542 RepID=A0A1G2AZW0_9BACT|nr:MAG: hypothetical protein A3F54_02655 [Candidatus Kerfeldbacteria bacterium RIFCSPHIGHO2_12_FULL_48_17]
MKKLIVQVGSTLFQSIPWIEEQFPAINGKQNKDGADEMWMPYHNANLRGVREQSWREREVELGWSYRARLRSRGQGVRMTESSMTKSHSVSKGTAADDMFPLEAANAERWSEILLEDEDLTKTYFPEEIVALSILGNDERSLTPALEPYGEMILVAAGGERTPLWAAAHHLAAYIRHLAPGWAGKMRFETIRDVKPDPGHAAKYFSGIWASEFSYIVGYEPDTEVDFLATNWPMVAALQAEWRTPSDALSPLKKIFKIQDPEPGQYCYMALWEFTPEETTLDGQKVGRGF